MLITKKEALCIYVDADACPVKEDIMNVTADFSVDVYFIASYAHSTEAPGQWVFVDADKEEVDMYIVNHARRHNIVITQDHGLASLLSHREVYVLAPTGKRYKEEDMNELLWARHLSAKHRRAGGKTKGPSKFTTKDHADFSQALRKILKNLEGHFDSLSNNE